MGAEKLKTVFLGLNENNRCWLEALGRSGYFQVVSIAGTEPEILEKYRSQLGCTSFSDYRQLIVQNDAQVLFDGAALYVSAEHIRSAMKKKFGVIRPIPPGLDFESAAEFVRTAKREQVGFFIAKPACFYPGFCNLKNLIETEQPAGFRLIRAVCNFPEESDRLNDRWLNDPTLAGGGVLLYNGYELIDWIVSSFGVPEQVYCITGNSAPDRQQRIAITEDTAVVTMRFCDTLICHLSASREFGPPSMEIQVHRQKQFFRFRPDEFAVLDNAGKVIRDEKYRFCLEDMRDKTLDNIALCIAEKQDPPDNTGQNELDNMALIEAAYLSARTAMPEQPGRFLKFAKT